MQLRRVRPRPLPGLALAALFGAASAPAQAPTAPAWALLSVPGGIAAPAVQGQGKLVAVQSGAHVHVFSAFTGRWHTTSTAGGASVRLFNDVCLVADGPGWQALSAYRGEFVPLTAGPGAAVLNPIAQRNDSLVLVADGAVLHAFSGFTGQWHTRTFAPGFASRVQRHVAIVASGSSLTAIDAATGTWTDAAASAPPSWIDADGTVAFAREGGVVHAFSAPHLQWRTSALPPNGHFVRGDDWGCFYGNGATIAFSALRCSFAATPHVVSSVAASTDLFGLLQTQDGLLPYSAVAGTFGDLEAVPTTLTIGDAVALFTTNGRVRGYSALLHAVERLAVPVTSPAAAGIVGSVVEAGRPRPWLFSAVTGRFHEGPTDADGPTLLTTTAAGVPTANGVSAFDARRGTFVALPIVGLTLAGNPSSAPLLALGPQDVAAFDAKRGEWRVRTRSATTPPMPQVWRTSALVIDGSEALAFPSQVGGWGATPLLEPPVAVRANSEVAYVVGASTVLASTMLPDAAALAQFPDFRRVQPFGADLHGHVAVPPSTAAIVGVALPILPTPVAGLGLLELDTNTLVTQFVLSDAAAHSAAWTIAVPPAPSLRGATAAVQALVLPVLAPPYLTRADRVQLW
jgi:hypothetical protein